ncbi:MAG: carboxypeptidase-like regulatory domain-containing protein, partial [Bacteroidota bacterium]
MQVVTDIKYVFIAITSLLLSSNFIYGQSIKGIVIDGDHTPLGFVNILLKNPQDSTIIDFAITNNAGKFEFDTIPLNGILLSTSAIGYASFDTMLYQVSKQSEINLSIQLANKDYDLQQVEVNAYKNGVIINGDTTIYDPSTFTTGQEENVEELLKKLPGIVVEDGGKISVGGKEVENVLIEGDDFLDENRKAVLEGLSAESVSSVEIIGNYEAYSDLADFNTESEQKYAINIKLTKDAKSKIHGNVQLSGGHEDRYEAIADLYKIKEKSKFFINANTGNTGQNTLSIYDYIQLEGGLQNFTEQRSKGDRKIPRIFLDKERYNQINSNYLGFNFSKNIGSKLEMDGFAFAYLNNSKSSSVKRETPSHLGITNIYDKSKNDQLKTLAAKFNLDFKPSKKENWNYSSKVLLENTAETLQNRTQFFGNRFESQNHTTSEPFQIQNQINYR